MLPPHSPQLVLFHTNHYQALDASRCFECHPKTERATVIHRRHSTREFYVLPDDKCGKVVSVCGFLYLNFQIRQLLRKVKIANTHRPSSMPVHLRGF